MDMMQCKISYIYDAAGTKLSKIVDETANQSVTDYCGPFIYQNNQLQMVLTVEGRLMKTVQGYDCQYYLRDHLGIINVVFHEDKNTHFATIVQEDQFYPYGMKLRRLSTTFFIEIIQNKKFMVEGLFIN